MKSDFSFLAFFGSHWQTTFKEPDFFFFLTWKFCFIWLLHLYKHFFPWLVFCESNGMVGPHSYRRWRWWKGEEQNGVQLLCPYLRWLPRHPTPACRVPGRNLGFLVIAQYSLSLNKRFSTFCNSLQENLDWKWDFQHRDCQYATAILWRWLSWLSHTSLNITAKILWPSFSKAQAKMCDLLLLHHSIISELCSSLLTWP